MSKPFAIVSIIHRTSFTTVFLTAMGLFCFSKSLPAGDPPKPDDPPKYPIAVAVDGDAIYTVDLDLPGIWKTTDGKRSLFYAGSNLLRKPMNRPRPIVMHPDGGVLVGDSPTREIYHIPADGSEAKPIGGGYLGIPMALAISPDGETLYIGDAERRATFKMPIAGIAKGEAPELVARVNARGLSFAPDGTLYAVTPDADAVVAIDVATGDVKTVLGERPFEYPGGMVWVGDAGYVSDVYAKAIWKFTADGNVEKWHDGDPLAGPVLMTADDKAIYVADPKTLQVYRFDLSDKTHTAVLGELN